jgi:LysM repeat protein
MRTPGLSRAAIGIVFVADLAFIASAKPKWSSLAAGVGHLDERLAADGADAVLGSLGEMALWFASVWLAVAVTLAFAQQIPGRVGAIAGRMAAFVSPAVMRSVLAGGLGAGIVLAPIVASAATPDAGLHGQRASASGSVLDPVTWPDSDNLSTAQSINWPLSDELAQAPGDVSTTSPVTQIPGLDRAVSIVVNPGDSLWSISSASLGPAATNAQIAAEWPRWYEANAATIGSDPQLIRAGITLVAPDSAGKTVAASPTAADLSLRPRACALLPDANHRSTMSCRCAIYAWSGRWTRCCRFRTWMLLRHHASG